MTHLCVFCCLFASGAILKPFASFGFLTVSTTRNLSNSGFASIEVMGTKHGMGDPILTHFTW